MQREPLFPKEVTGTVPRITMTGAERVHIEQHQGLMAYQEEEVVFRTSLGMLRISGSGLRFTSYTSGEAILTGSIQNIGIQPSGGRV
ncbi:MAG: YabP/YqfC family sporulation protein [Clostridia bacterium]|nr:YabP/YqfC family sporulation protein [Clostridia bacterium]